MKGQPSSGAPSGKNGLIARGDAGLLVSLLGPHPPKATTARKTTAGATEGQNRKGFMALSVHPSALYPRLRCRLQEPFQVPGSHWILQLLDRFGFDLSHAFAGDFEDAADFFERVRVAVGQ